MSKPTDVTDDVWADAGAVEAGINGYDRSNADRIAIARAILAAKAEERNACVRAAIECRIDVPLSPGLPDGASIAKNAIVAAIRKRGEG